MWHQPACTLHIASPSRLKALAALKPLLSAEEFLELYRDAPAAELPPQETYEVALALMTVGVATASPPHIVQARACLQAVDSALLTSLQSLMQLISQERMCTRLV